MNLWDMLESATVMAEKDFWMWIEKSRGISENEGLAMDKALGQLLSFEDPQDVAGFHLRFKMIHSALDTDAIHSVLGGSDDGFYYEKCWAISKGKAYCHTLLFNPLSLAGSITKEYELFEYAASYAVDEVFRSQLQAAGLSRREAEMLKVHIEAPPLVGAKPRI
jgi:hypothetical protein